MIKTFATVTALGALAIAPALAQSNMQKPSEPPAAQAPAKSGTGKDAAAPSTPSAPKSASPTTPAAPKTASPKQSAPSQTTASASNAAEKPAIVSEQRSDQWLASSFKGTDVMGPENKKIGDVSDILFDQNGAIKAYVVDVGGFLGIGAKSVAIEPSSFQVVTGEKADEKKLKLSMTADELKQAAEFKPRKTEPRQTTGTSPSKGPASAPPASKN
jgi:hypothetical protein